MLIINLLYLKTFLTVCDNGNFTEAAKLLFVPQPTISNRIRYLEEELGQELFVRGKKGKRSVELTKAGKVFMPYAKQIMDILDTAKDELNGDTNENLMTIGSSIALTHPFIYQKVNLLNEVHKKNINLLIMDHSLIANSLEDGIVDLAFVTEAINNKKLESHPVYSEKVGLIVSKKHPLANKKQIDRITDLENEYLIFYKTFSKDQTKVKNIKCKKRVVTNQMELVNDLIHNHNGVSFLPPNAFDSDIKNGKLVHIPINDELLDCKIDYFLVIRRNEVYYEDIFLSDKPVSF